MAIDDSGWWAWAVQVLNLGQMRPNGDFDKMGEFADLWEQARQLLVGYTPGITDALQKADAHYQGAGEDSFHKQVAFVLTDSQSSLAKLADSMPKVSDTIRTTRSSEWFTARFMDVMAGQLAYQVAALAWTAWGNAAIPLRVAITKRLIALARRECIDVVEGRTSAALAEASLEQIASKVFGDMAAGDMSRVGAGDIADIVAKDLARVGFPDVGADIAGDLGTKAAADTAGHAAGDAAARAGGDAAARAGADAAGDAAGGAAAHAGADAAGDAVRGGARHGIEDAAAQSAADAAEKQPWTAVARHAVSDGAWMAAKQGMWGGALTGGLQLANPYGDLDGEAILAAGGGWMGGALGGHVLGAVAGEALKNRAAFWRIGGGMAAAALGNVPGMTVGDIASRALWQSGKALNGDADWSNVTAGVNTGQFLPQALMIGVIHGLGEGSQMLAIHTNAVAKDWPQVQELFGNLAARNMPTSEAETAAQRDVRQDFQHRLAERYATALDQYSDGKPVELKGLNRLRKELDDRLNETSDRRTGAVLSKSGSTAEPATAAGQANQNSNTNGTRAGAGNGSTAGTGGASANGSAPPAGANRSAGAGNGATASPVVAGHTGSTAQHTDSVPTGHADDTRTGANQKAAHHNAPGFGSGDSGGQGHSGETSQTAAPGGAEKKGLNWRDWGATQQEAGEKLVAAYLAKVPGHTVDWGSLSDRLFPADGGRMDTMSSGQLADLIHNGTPEQRWFAITEAIRREGLDHGKTQILRGHQHVGGLAVADQIVNMETAQGKTFTVGAAAAELAVRHGVVQVWTSSDYLASRDYQFQKRTWQDQGFDVVEYDPDQPAPVNRDGVPMIVVTTPDKVAFGWARAKLEGEVPNTCPGDVVVIDEIEKLLADGGQWCIKDINGQDPTEEEAKPIQDAWKFFEGNLRTEKNPTGTLTEVDF
ncbi:hypothetical protein ABZW16_32280, partial [Nocardia sp. NPDC004604]